MTNVPIVLSVAPMTSAPAVTSTGIASPVSIAASTAEPPSTTTPSTGTGRPAGRAAGRRHRRRPSDTSTSRSPSTRRATGGCRPMQPADRTGRAGLRARLEPPAEQDETDDDRRGVEVRLRVQAGLVDRRPGTASRRRCRAQAAVVPTAIERVHVGRAVPGGPPGRTVEAAARPDLDERGRHERQPVDGPPSATRVADEHRDHDRERDPDRHHRLDGRSARARDRDGCRPRRPPQRASPAQARRRGPVRPGRRSPRPRRPPRTRPRPATSGR